MRCCNRCYVTRTSLKCVSPGLSYGSGDFPDGNKDVQRWKPDNDTRVCFQYSAIDSHPKGSKGYKSDDELYAQLVQDLQSYGAVNVQVECCLPAIAQYIDAGCIVGVCVFVHCGDRLSCSAVG